MSAKDADWRARSHDASVTGSAAAIVAFTKCGDDKDARGGKGVAPLQFVAMNGWVSVIDALIELRAAINLQSTEGDASALDSTALAGRVNALKALARHGADAPATPAVTLPYSSRRLTTRSGRSIFSPRQG